MSEAPVRPREPDLPDALEPLAPPAELRGERMPRPDVAAGALAAALGNAAVE